MAKSNRRRKQDRAKRQVRAERQREITSRRRTREATQRAMIERYAAMVDPATPAPQVAALIAGHFSGLPVFPEFVPLHLGTGATPGRLAEIIAAMRSDQPDGEPPSLTALTFAAAAARAVGDTGASFQLLGEALAAAGKADDEIRVRVYGHLGGAGRTADAIELLEGRMRDAPDDDLAAEYLGVQLGRVNELVHDEAPGGDCPCGRGRPWADCCGRRERAALDRFADRSGLVTLADAVGAFLARSAFGPAIDDHVSGLLSDSDELDWDPADVAMFRALAAEHALLESHGALAANPDDTFDEADEQGEDDDRDIPLTAFAMDPTVPVALADLARTWVRHVHYGLWRLEDRNPGPGVWCTDLVTALTRYVEIPPEIAARSPRWAVWLGAVVPVDGIWRATGTGFQLSPVEADAAVELIEDAATVMLAKLSGKPARGQVRQPGDPMRIGRAEPYGVEADLSEPASPLAADLLSKVAGALATRIAAEVLGYRSAPALADEKRIDPAQDFAWPARGLARAGGAAPTAEGWEAHWVDEPVPALGGSTPRQATEGKEQPRLETLLRQFEYEADLLADQGKSGIDTSWIREELGMPVSEDE